MCTGKCSNRKDLRCEKGQQVAKCCDTDRFHPVSMSVEHGTEATKMGSLAPVPEVPSIAQLWPVLKGLQCSSS